MVVAEGRGRPVMCRNSAALYVPCDWLPVIKRYMEREGIYNYTALFRHLIAKHIINKGGEVER